MRRALSIMFLMLAAGLGSPHGARAAVPLDEAWRWVTFTTESGLPSDHAYSVVSSPNGPWALTQQGLARFDGWAWSPVELPGAAAGIVPHALVSDGRGGVLIVAGSLLCRGTPAGVTLIPLRDPAHAGWWIESAVAFRGAALVLARPRELGWTGALLLVSLDGRALPAGASDDVPPAGSFLADVDGMVFMASGSSVFASDGGPWQVVMSRAGARPTPSVISGSRGGEYLLSMNPSSGLRGLFSWRSGEGAKELVEAGMEEVVSLAVARDGDAVVAYDSGALRWRHDGTWRTLAGSWPMLRDASWMGYDTDGSLWSCTRVGVHRARAAAPRWSVVADTKPSRHNSVNSILRSSDGSIWLGTRQGILHRRSDGTTERVEEAAGISVADVTSLAEDGHGRIWATSGSAFEGALLLDGGSWSRVLSADLSSRPFIHHVVIDHGGQPRFLALAAPDAPKDVGAGVLREEGGRLVPWEPARGIPSQRVYDMAFGANGDVWFATFGGLCRLRGGEWTTWDDHQGLKSSRVFSVTLDDAGRPWFTHQVSGVGTLGADGLVRYLGVDDGLPEGEAWSVASDSSGRLWVATAAGLGCIEGDVAWALGLESGLPLIRTWPLLAERGQIIVGTLGAGAAILSLAETKDPAPRVQIAIVGTADESVHVSWRALAWQGIVPPSALETRHRLDGGEWSRWSRERSAVIPLRSEGRRIEVEARSPFPGGAAGRANRLVEVTMAWYRRPWFYGLEAMLGVAALVALGILVLRRRRQAIDLRHSEGRFRLLSSVVTEGVAVVEARGRILDANAALGELLGRDPAGLIGSQLPAILNRSIPEAGAAPVELIVHRPDGEERVAEMLARAHPWRGHGATVVVVRDVTERKRAETDRLEMELRLRRAHELESLGLLAGRIAHDFNNMLTAVIGNQDLAAESAADPIVRHHLEHAGLAARQAADLSQAMLAASGRGRLAVRDVDLSAHVDQMIDFLKASLPKTTNIARELERDLPAIEADPTQVSQLILNLVTNASDSIGERGGTITLRTRTSEDGAGVMLEVADDGAGMDADTRARLFEPFFTTRTEGRGLGLATVSAVAKAHAASIEVESEPGRGAMFRVTFAATARRVALPPPPPERPVAAALAAMGLVLVADDEDIVRRITVAFAKRLGATVVEAVDGAEALRIVAERGDELDAAILDLTMPLASGLDVLAAIRRANPQLSVVLVTGHSEDDVAARVAGDGFVRVLAKPFSLAQLTQAVAAIRSEREP